MQAGSLRVRNMIKWFIISLLVFTIGVSIYFAVLGNVFFRRDILCVLILILWIVLWNSKWTFIPGIILCVYGLYNLLLMSVIAAEPTFMQFTSPLIYLFFGTKTGSWLHHTIALVPLFFYFFYLLFLLSKKGRIYYGVKF
jgi:hypothetical protein